MKTYQDIKLAAYIDSIINYTEMLLGIRFTKVKKNRYNAPCTFHADTEDNFTAIVANTTKDEIDKLSERRNFQYQINFAQALSKMKHTIVLLFTRPVEHVKLIITKLQKIFSQTVEQVRPERSFRRKHKVKLKKFHFAYKRIS